MVSFEQTEEELINLLYCTFEEDGTGEACDKLVAELLEEGVYSAETLRKCQTEASKLFAKHDDF